MSALDSPTLTSIPPEDILIRKKRVALVSNKLCLRIF